MPVSQLQKMDETKPVKIKDPLKMNRSGAATRERLLGVSRELFVQHGYTGTSMTQIAAKAGVNHSLLFHHFGSKLNLWLDVKEMIIEEGKKAFLILPSSDQPLASFLRELVTQSIIFYKNNPDIIRIINWQRLESITGEEITFVMTHESEAWINITKHYQQRGEIDPSLKPEFITMMVLALTTSIATDPNVFANDPVAKAAYVEFCIERLQKALSHTQTI
jgi:AcrR family transcriptional regulator